MFRKSRPHPGVRRGVGMEPVVEVGDFYVRQQEPTVEQSKVRVFSHRHDVAEHLADARQVEGAARDLRGVSERSA